MTKRLFCLILAALLATTTIAQDKHPLNGTWKANLEKSKRDPNHMFSSLTMTIDVSSDLVMVTFNGVNKEGKEEGGSTKLIPDGKSYPVPQAQGFVQITKWLNANTLETSAQKDGTIVGKSTYEVSPNGKELTVRIHGIDAKGLPFDQIIVLDRQ